MRLEHQELRIFAAVAAQNGFKRASDFLCITQSAVSQAVASLERKLDLVLFHRRPLSLTDAGVRLLRHARQVQQEEEIVLSDLEEIRQGDAASLSLAINSVINRYYAPQLVSRFCELNPYARLHIDEMPSREIISAVLTGRVELGIGPFESRMPAFVTEELFRETRLLVVSRKHSDIDEILAYPTRALQRVPLLASYVDDAAQRPGSGRIRERFSRVWLVRSISMRLELLAAGQGAGFISDKVLHEDPLCADFVVIDKAPFARIVRSVGLFYRSGHELSEGASKFVSICQDQQP
ncbi:MAG: DNA-binding transcriptional LysR family regulator [Halieaceae bacterium]|jgi:DNA-binding transcriptional LysR family regulator